MNIINTQPKTITDYGCTKCQRFHEKDTDPLYEEHLFFQSKHGIRQWIDCTRYEPTEAHSSASAPPGEGEARAVKTKERAGPIPEPEE